MVDMFAVDVALLIVKVCTPLDTFVRFALNTQAVGIPPTYRKSSATTDRHTTLVLFRLATCPS